MPEGIKTYATANGTLVNVPESKVDTFLELFPDSEEYIGIKDDKGEEGYISAKEFGSYRSQNPNIRPLSGAYQNYFNDIWSGASKPQLPGIVKQQFPLLDKVNDLAGPRQVVKPAPVESRSTIQQPFPVPTPEEYEEDRKRHELYEKSKNDTYDISEGVKVAWQNAWGAITEIPDLVVKELADRFSGPKPGDFAYGLGYDPEKAKQDPVTQIAQKIADDADVRIQQHVLKLQEASVGNEGWAYAGASIPTLFELGAATFSRSPELTKLVIDKMAATAYLKSGVAYDNHIKETGEQPDGIRKTAYQVANALIFKVNFTALSKGLSPKYAKDITQGLANKLFGGNTAQQVTNATKLISKAVENSPVSKKLFNDVVHGTGIGTAFGVSQDIADRVLMGQDKTFGESVKEIAESAVSMAAFSGILSPIGLFAQKAGNIARWEKSKDPIIFTTDAKGNPVEIFRDGTGRTVDGKVIEVTPDMHSKAFAVPYSVIEKTKIELKSGVEPTPKEREVTQYNVEMFANGVSDGKGNINIITLDDGTKLYLKRIDGENAIVFDENANKLTIPVKDITNTEYRTVNEMVNEKMAEWDRLNTKQPEQKQLTEAEPTHPQNPIESTVQQTVARISPVINENGTHIVTNAHVDGKPYFIKSGVLLDQDGKPDLDSIDPSTPPILVDSEGNITNIPFSDFDPTAWEVRPAEAMLDEKQQELQQQAIEEIVEQPGLEQQASKQPQELTIGKKKYAYVEKEDGDHYDLTGSATPDKDIEVLNKYLGQHGYEAVPVTTEAVIPAASKYEKPTHSKVITGAIVRQKTATPSIEERADGVKAYVPTQAEAVGERQPVVTKKVIGKETNREFATGVAVKGNLTVMDVSELQPSHVNMVRNPKHGISLAQPKERNDKVSDAESTKIANNPKWELLADKTMDVYHGAPTVNTYGEVIQGNNRSEALLKYWQHYPTDGKGLKAYLLENADALGLNKAAIAQMDKPVLVNMVDADDATAIKLGQYTAQDLETGGIRRITPKETLRKLDYEKQKRLIEIITEGADSESQIAETIRDNGIAALRYLVTQKAISDTQYQSAIKDGNITPDAVTDIKELLKYNLFSGASSNFDTYFSALPARVQNGLIKASILQADNPEDYLTTELQTAIIAYKEYVSITEGGSKATVGEWANMIDMFTGETPKDKYGGFALVLANLFNTAKKESDINIPLRMYYTKVNGDNDTIFPDPKVSKQQAIKDVFNHEYRDNKTDTGINQEPLNTGVGGEPERSSRSEPGDRAGDGDGAVNQAGTNNGPDAEIAVEPGQGIGTEEEIVPETTTEAKDLPQPTQAEIDTQLIDEDIASQSHNNNPTDKEKETGIYDKARISLQGYNITIETKKGQQRSGVDKGGKAWSITMNNHYGELDGTKGYDGDAIDVFVGPNPKQGQIFVIDQLSDNGAFDESKVMLGFDSAEQAKEAYMSNYEAGWQGFGNITPAGDNFKAWLYDGKKQRKPFSEYKETPEPVLSSTGKADNSEESEPEETQLNEIDRVNEKLGKRNIWIPNMKQSKLEKLLNKESLTENDIEDLKDYEYFLLTDKQSATEKGFYQKLAVSQQGEAYVLKNKYLLQNIQDKIKQGVATDKPKFAGDLVKEMNAKRAIPSAVNTQTLQEPALIPDGKAYETSQGNTIRYNASEPTITGKYAIKGQDITNTDTGEFCAVERLLNEQKHIDLTGTTTIKSPDDVAFLFRHLEEASSENAFAVFIKPDKSYKVLYLSTGSTTGTLIDTKLIALAAKEFKAKSVTFVHNHPSGNLMTSEADVNLHKRVVTALKGICNVNPGIIINLDSGKYAEFGFDNYETKQVNYNKEASKVKVYQFDKQKLYTPSIERQHVTGSTDVARVLSKIKRGTDKKYIILVLDRRNNVTRALLDNDISPKHLLPIIAKHGEAVIISGNSELEMSKLKEIKSQLQAAEISFLDYVQVETDADIIKAYKSYADEGYMYEPETNYETGTVYESKPTFAGEAIEQILKHSAYHGSPHSFDKFSTEFMGSGEGAQAYGWGLYFTDKKTIAESYAKSLSDISAKQIKFTVKDYYETPLSLDEFERMGRIDGDVVDRIKESIIDYGARTKEDVIESLRERALKGKTLLYQNYRSLLYAKDFVEGLTTLEIPQRNLYQVSLHDGKTPDQYDYLRWDKGLTKTQKRAVENIFNDIINNEPDYHKQSSLSNTFAKYDFENATGESVYKDLSFFLSGDKATRGVDADKKASLALLAEGIDGIKYPAEYTSKGTHEDAFNYVVFDENAVKIEDHILFHKQSPIGFYSPVESALTKIQQSKGTPEQFKAMLLKNGAKQAEMDWMDFDGAFGDKKSVTKQDVQEWIDQNKIEVEEVKKEQNDNIQLIDSEGNSLGIFSSVEEAKKSVDKKGGWLFTTTGERLVDGTGKTLINLIKGVPEINTKFSQYVLPGGKNYREVLLTMPAQSKWKIQKDQYGIWIADGGYNGNEHIEGETKEDVERQISDYERVKSNAGTNNTFRSSHYDEPNILAHIRFNERTVNGERVLFIEEFQSDWSQSGRDKGFKGDESKVEKVAYIEEYDFRVKNLGDTFYAELKDGTFRYLRKDENISTSEKARHEFYKLFKKETDARNERLLQDFNNRAVPDMPFRKTDQWLNLAFRRVLRYAAENGFDRIAWTNGEQQADRYDLSKQVKSIDWGKNHDGTYDVQGDLIQGGYYTKRKLDAQGIADNFGKEIADKITTSDKTEGVIEGVDLKVGGSGMKTFYDQIVPNAANKLGKAFGSKTETIDIPLSKPIYNLTVKNKLGNTSNHDFDSLDMKNKMKEAYLNNGAEIISDEVRYNNITQQSIPITPSMRESVLGGVPLFHILGETEARNAQTRINLTPEQRREQLLSETADVAPEDQIVIFDAIGISQLNVKPTHEEVKAHIESVMKAKGNNTQVAVHATAQDAMDEYKQSGVSKTWLDKVQEALDDTSADGFYDSVRGHILIISDRITSTKDLTNVLNHESVHAENQSMFGADRRNVLSFLFDEISTEELFSIVPMAYNQETSVTLADEYCAFIIDEMHKQNFVPSLETFKKQEILEIVNGVTQKPVNFVERLITTLYHGTNSKPIRGNTGRTSRALQNTTSQNESNGGTSKEEPQNDFVGKSSGNQNSEIFSRYQVDGTQEVFYDIPLRDGGTGRIRTNPTGTESNGGQIPESESERDILSTNQGESTNASGTKEKPRFAGELLGQGSLGLLKSVKSDEIIVDGIKRSRTNNLGHPIANSDEGIRNFWKWFSDSKIVDSEGRPLVVYHGTSSDFSEFNQGKEGGMFFTPIKRIAEIFATNVRKGKLSLTPNETPSVMPIYLRISKPNILNYRYKQSVSGVTTDITKSKKRGFDGVILEGANDVGGRMEQYVAFSPTQIKSATGNNGGFTPDDPNILKHSSGNGIHMKRIIGKKDYGDRFAEWIAENVHSVDLWQKEMLKDGIKGTKLFDVYQETRLRKGKIKGLVDKFDKGPFKTLEENLAKLIDTNKTPLSEIQKYIKAKSALERNDNEGISAISEDPADDWNRDNVTNIIQEFEAKTSPTEITELWDNIKAATDFCVDILFNKGIINKEALDKYKGRNYYVPLRGWEFNETNPNPESFYDYINNEGNGINSQTYVKATIKAKGRTSEPGDPLPYIRQIAHSSIMSGVKNNIARTALNLFRMNAKVPEMGSYMYIKEPFKGNAHEAMRTRATAEKHEIVGYDNGDRFTLVLGDPHVAQAIKGENVLLQETAKFLGDSWMGKLTHFMKANFTGKNPNFFLNNFMFIDVPYAAITEGIRKEGESIQFAKQVLTGKPFKTIHRDITNNLNPLTKGEAIAAGLNSKASFKAAIDQYGESRIYDTMYEMWKDAGGPTGWMQLESFEKSAKKIENEVKRIQAKEAGLGKEFTKLSTKDKFLYNYPLRKGAELMEYVMAMSEQSSRFAVFVSRKMAGQSTQQAALASKEATVDFDRTGQAGTVFNQLFAFFKPTVSATYGVYKMAKDNKEKFGYALGSFFALGVIQAILAYMSMPEDESGESQYDNLHDYEILNNLIIPRFWDEEAYKEAKYVKIPMPQFFRAIFALGVTSTQVAMGKRDAIDFATTNLGNLVSAMTPFNLSGEDPARVLVPTAVIPAYDIAVNRAFTGKQVYKEQFTKTLEDRVPHSQEGKYNTWGPLTEATQWLNEFGGGNQYNRAGTGINTETGLPEKDALKAFMFDWNPAKIQHVAESYGGGRLKFWRQTFSAAYNAVSPDVEVKEWDIPLFYRYLGSAKSENPMTNYYNASRIVDDYKYQLGILKKDDIQEFTNQLKTNRFMNELTFLVKSTKKRIDYFEDLNEKVTDKNKLEAINDSIQSSVVSFNKKLGTLENKYKVNIDKP